MICMDAGMISYDNLTDADFLLPEKEQPFLPGTKNRHPLFYLGLSNWNYKEEERKKNSPDPQPGTLPFYAGHFNCTLFTDTFNEIPSMEKIGKWAKSIENIDFNVCPQFYKAITHIGKVGTQKLGVTTDFINRMKGFQDKLGVSLMQLPDSYSAAAASELLQYLAALPAGYALAVELINEDWFSTESTFNALVEKLHRLDKTLVITDTPGRRDALHMQLSNATAFIRFTCLGWNELDLFRISQWKKQIQSWYLQGLERCYFFMDIRDKEGADDFINYVKEECSF